MTRVPPSNLICCLDGCQDSNPLDSRVEVKTLLPTQGISRIKAKLLVNWRENGEAEFHVKCWETILELSRKRMNPGLRKSMCKEEKALVKVADEAAEKHDGVDDIRKKAKKAADWIKHSKHCVAFTGAGISTSAGIGDYRGKAGKWTEEDQSTFNMEEVFACTSKGTTETSRKRKASEDEKHNLQNSEDSDFDEDGVPYEKLRPTYTHEALYKLMETGYLKYIISQNGDGLHGLSGIDTDKISELHGNVFKEYCEKCGKMVDRKFYVMDDIGSQYFEETEDFGSSVIKKPRHARKCDHCGLSHRTGRRCEEKGCTGYLRDTIINFRDLLDEKILDRAKLNSKQCDVMVCLGTTLQVTPACDLVRKMKDKDQLIICNRQETPIDHLFDKRAKDGTMKGCRVFGNCDLFIREIMKHIFTEKELTDWESGRGQRLEQYASLRE